MRNYPILSEELLAGLEPISFVVVHFCGDYFHNILKSDCVLDPTNQLVTVDNRAGHAYDNLSSAINAGVDRAEHDLIAVVHEDVLLTTGWQYRFQRSLNSLEAADPNWGLLGSVGWTEKGPAVGHWSDPHRYENTLEGRDFGEVRRLDEQLLVFRKSRGLRFDDLLPSIHNIGRDLSATLSGQGRKTYAIDAPTIHKFADEKGRPIGRKEDSPKITDRTLPANLAEWDCSNTYFIRKWPDRANEVKSRSEPDLGGAPAGDFGPPVILLARGGSGSRLLSILMHDLDVFIGDTTRESTDSDEMRAAIYRGVLSKYQRRADWQRAEIVPRLRAAAAAMLETREPGGLWGFKLPESLLILPELDAAFPGARYVHLLRDPLTTCLRRAHMTARLDNAIGRTAVRAAYGHFGRDLAESLDAPPAMLMAVTTRHQVELALDQAAARFGERYTEVRFEEILDDAAAARQQVADWLGAEPVHATLEQVINPERAASPSVTHTKKVSRAVAAELAPLRRRLGYL